MTRRNNKHSRPHGSGLGRFLSLRRPSGRRRLLTEQLEPRWVMAAVTPDTTFGTGGLTITPIGPAAAHDAATDMKIQPWDQKIVIVGEATNAAGNLDFFVARYNTDGTLDTSFGAGGSVLTPIGTETDQAAGVDFQTIGANDKKIISGGYYTVAHNDLEVDTFNSLVVSSASRPFGVEDRGEFLTITNANGFFAGQYQILDTFAGFALLNAPPAALGATGGNFRLDRGDSTTNLQDNKDFVVVRYLPDGNIDASFGDGGRVITPVREGNDFLYSVVVQPWDDKIVVVGYSGNTSSDFAFARLTESGTLDVTFDADGRTTVPIAGTSTDAANKVRIQTNGSIIAVGTANLTTGSRNRDVALVRLLSTGALDPSFDTDGVLSFPVGTNDHGNGLVLQTDAAVEKIVVTGTAFGTNTQSAVFLARLNPDGGFDNTFDTDGLVTAEPTDNQFNYSAAVDIHKDATFPAIFQKIVIAGMTRLAGNPVNDNAFVMRFSDPPLSTLTAQNATATEENGTKTKLITVTLSSASTQQVKVKYSTSSGSATAGSDFQETIGTLTFAPGIKTAYVTVPIVGNAIGEHDETFTLNLSDPIGAAIAKAQATCSIKDDDGWWMNPEQPTDVTGDGDVVALDALVLVNDLNANGNGRELPWIAPGSTGHFYLDVNSDGVVSAVDALIVINDLNAPAGAAAVTQAPSIAQGLHAQSLATAIAVDAAITALSEEEEVDRIADDDTIGEGLPSQAAFVPADELTAPARSNDPRLDLDELLELIAPTSF